jgi:hypothetical protein
MDLERPPFYEKERIVKDYHKIQGLNIKLSEASVVFSFQVRTVAILELLMAQI